MKKEFTYQAIGCDICGKETSEIKCFICGKDICGACQVTMRTTDLRKTICLEHLPEKLVEHFSSKN